MSTKSHLKLMALYPSLLVSSTAKTALVEIERLEARLAIAVEALEDIGHSQNCSFWTSNWDAPSCDCGYRSALAQIKETK